jgi:hypothetical protein
MRSNYSFQQNFPEFENSIDSSAEEEFENHFRTKKEKKVAKFEPSHFMSQAINNNNNNNNNNIFNKMPLYYQPVPAPKIIPEKIPLVRSSNQTTIELLHAVQLIFHDRGEEAVRVIEIHNPQSDTRPTANLSMEFL